MVYKLHACYQNIDGEEDCSFIIPPEPVPPVEKEEDDDEFNFGEWVRDNWLIVLLVIFGLVVAIIFIMMAVGRGTDVPQPQIVPIPYPDYQNHPVTPLYNFG